MGLGPVAEPIHASDSVFRILTVCTANICRSPGAERLLALELSQRDIADSLQIKIGSAGLRGWEQVPMDADAAAALTRRGGMPDGFKSRPIFEPIVDESSLILTATREHRSDLVANFPRALRRTFTMKEFALLTSDPRMTFESARDLVAAAYSNRGGTDIEDTDVADPYGGPPEVHDQAMAEIHVCMAAIADAITRCTRA